VKYKEAQALLKKAVHEQKTIDTGKLKQIINALNISLTKEVNPELQVLKAQLKELKEYKAEYERVKQTFIKKGVQPIGGWRK
jgi:hypothetical protein